jgi:hypothetical protein
LKRNLVSLLPAFLAAMAVTFLAVPARAVPVEHDLQRVERGQPLAPCPQPHEQKGYVAREGRGDGFTVDSCGRKTDSKGEMLSPEAVAGETVTEPVTIDRMTTSYTFGSHTAGGSFVLVGSANVYDLSNGSHWSSGAGSYYLNATQLDHVEVSGTTIRYVMYPPASLYQQTDYDSGDHSAQGRLDPSGALVIEAQAGSTTAVLHANALLASNEPTWYGEPRFNYYTAIVGSVLPIEMTYTMQGGSTWTADAFSRPFSYSVAGFVDFAHPVSEQRVSALSIAGPSQLPDDFTTRFVAIATYENGVQHNVSSTASWTVDPAEPASIVGGFLTIGTLAAPETPLTLRATFAQGADTVVAEKQVLVLADITAEKPGTWPMFQANARHTGYLGITVNPAAFRLKWQRDVGSGRPLNPVAAGDGKVFATLVTYFNNILSLFALRASDGETLWSKGFGDTFSVNPPSYAYGSVYVQTGNHASDTWLRAFDGNTGDVLFKTPHAAQWERYFAPTIYDGKAYVNGGYYGGMYGFDAYTGDQLWFVALPQYDQWTPAVDADHAYGYVGDNAPGLYVRDRATGASSFFVADPNFDWNGWSMDLAPVLGDHDDVIAIHNGRLLSFDTASHAIRWEVQSQFTGQPSLAQGRIYAIDGGRLRVLDELTHNEIWSWQAGDGDLTGPMIVTDSHVFVSTDHSVHAVSLASRQSVWSYGVGGHLAYADDTLYVAGQDGTLTAFAGPVASSFYTVPPCRVVDTRGADGVPIGGPALTSGTVRNLHVAGLCGVPATATAITVNVTVTAAGSSGYLRLGVNDPGAVYSTINYLAGLSRSNNAILGLSPAGDLPALAVQTAGTTVHVIIDVSGYFE